MKMKQSSASTVEPICIVGKEDMKEAETNALGFLIAVQL
jgi:hypothetical protein